MPPHLHSKERFCLLFILSVITGLSLSHDHSHFETVQWSDSKVIVEGLRNAFELLEKERFESQFVVRSQAVRKTLLKMGTKDYIDFSGQRKVSVLAIFKFDISATGESLYSGVEYFPGREARLGEDLGVSDIIQNFRFSIGNFVRSRDIEMVLEFFKIDPLLLVNNKENSDLLGNIQSENVKKKYDSLLNKLVNTHSLENLNSQGDLISQNQNIENEEFNDKTESQIEKKRDSNIILEENEIKANQTVAPVANSNRLSETVKQIKNLEQKVIHLENKDFTETKSAITNSNSNLKTNEIRLANLDWALPNNTNQDFLNQKRNEMNRSVFYYPYQSFKTTPLALEPLVQTSIENARSLRPLVNPYQNNQNVFKIKDQTIDKRAEPNDYEPETKLKIEISQDKQKIKETFEEVIPLAEPIKSTFEDSENDLKRNLNDLENQIEELGEDMNTKFEFLRASKKDSEMRSRPVRIDDAIRSGVLKVETVEERPTKGRKTEISFGSNPLTNKDSKFKTFDQLQNKISPLKVSSNSYLRLNKQKSEYLKSFSRL